MGMATKRAPARRRKKKASRIPAIFLAGLIAGAGGVLFVRASDDTPDEPSSDTIAVDGSSAPSDSSVAPEDGSATDSTDSAPATDPSNLGNPVKVFSDTLGDLSIDQIIEDWTSFDPPQLPDVTAEVQPSWVENGRITANLPDGFYWGTPISTFDEDVRGVNFDIRQAFFGSACYQRFGNGVDACNNDYQVTPANGEQLYPGLSEDLIFVSLAVTPERNTALVPATFWNLLNTGLPNVVDIPNESGESLTAQLAGTPFLLTIVDGKVIAVEGIWVP